MLSYLTSVPAGRWSRKRGRGTWRVLFYLLFPDFFFFVSKLQICIIQGQPIKEDYNGAPRESTRVCV